MTDTQTPPLEPGAALLRAGRFFRPGTPSSDRHSIGLTGGREADARKLLPVVSVENFHGPRRRQTSDDPADAEEV
ncbi:hypothetical protein AB0G67_07355 [Streptomyces sp. NPDC021056]|uniref:hypothetical protein n=1 Tax=Streptomyces sp. NPDC021056 TaxID=3155012 RepID=UPI0033F46B4F